MKCARSLVLSSMCFVIGNLSFLSSNPKKIEQVSDLLRDNVNFINRQAGSGTRVLLDYELEKAGIDPDTINGYDNEEYTHMAVAVSAPRRVAGSRLLQALRFLPQA